MLSCKSSSQSTSASMDTHEEVYQALSRPGCRADSGSTSVVAL